MTKPCSRERVCQISGESTESKLSQVGLFFNLLTDRHKFKLKSHCCGVPSGPSTSPHKLPAQSHRPLASSTQTAEVCECVWIFVSRKETVIVAYCQNYGNQSVSWQQRVRLHLDSDFAGMTMILRCKRSSFSELIRDRRLPVHWTWKLAHV